jgi:DNA topoisomerase I
LLLSPPMRLIITEKNNSAKKIADILSAGSAKADATYKVPFYTWSDSEGEHTAVGLKGHVMGVAFPDEYSNWQGTDLHDLIDAKLIPEPTDKNVVKAVKKLAKEADSVVIATDFDREGELIGHEALQQALESNPEIVGGAPIEERPAVKRARSRPSSARSSERA